MVDGWDGERQIGSTLSEIDPLHVARYVEASYFCNRLGVADVGCGCGYGTWILAQKAFYVHGYDVSLEAIEYAGRCWSNLVNIMYANVDIGVIENKYDAVICFEVIEHLDCPIDETIDMLSKIVYDNGLLIVSHPNKEKPNQNKFHKHFDIDGNKFTQIVKKKGFDIIMDSYQKGNKGFDYHIVKAKKRI